MEDARVIKNSRWKKAEEQLKKACASNNIEPNAESYRRAVNRGWNHAINAILAGTFIEQEWLETPQSRYKRCVNEFKDFLREHNISPRKYQKQYGHRVRDGARLIYLGEELDPEYWTQIKLLPSKEEAYEIISQLCAAKGFATTDYQFKTRRYLKSFRRYIQENGIDRLDIINRRWLSCSEDPERDPERIKQYAASLISPGRKHGVSQLDFGNKYKKMIKCFYPGGLKGLNTDLGLDQIEHIPSSINKPVRLAETMVASRIARLENRIAAIHRSLDPAYLKRLGDELASLSEYESMSDSGTQDPCDTIDPHNEDHNIEEALAKRIKEALVLPNGYLYFKRWSLTDRTWFKIGITNDPSRRDREQNVLPVPSETLRVIRLASIEQARAVEKAIHITLAPRAVKGAKNKELFELNGTEYRAVSRVLRDLEQKHDRFH